MQPVVPWDGDDVVIELDASGNPVREYAHYPGIDRPHSMRRSSDGAIFYYGMEQPGHVSGLINTSNQLVNRYEYTPWGEPITTTEGVAQPLRYAARELDVETGLYYLRARYYDPKLGRFMSEDPIGLAGGRNLYAYVGSDPVSGRDPFGLHDDDPCPTGYDLIVEINIETGISTLVCENPTTGHSYVVGTIPGPIQLDPIVGAEAPCAICGPAEFEPGSRQTPRPASPVSYPLMGGPALPNPTGDRPSGRTAQQCFDESTAPVRNAGVAVGGAIATFLAVDAMRWGAHVRRMAPVVSPIIAGFPSATATVGTRVFNLGAYGLVAIVVGTGTYFAGTSVICDFDPDFL